MSEEFVECQMPRAAATSAVQPDLPPASADLPLCVAGAGSALEARHSGPVMRSAPETHEYIQYY